MDMHTHIMIILLGIAGLFVVTADATVFPGYDNNKRPTCNGPNTPVDVIMDLGLRQLIDLDEPVQLLKISLWVRLHWYDCRLEWNKTKQDGRTALVLPEGSVWTPDIEVYDSVSDDIRRERDFRVSISPTGNVDFNFQAVINSRCTVDVTSFPFDEQICPLSFGSWAYNGLDMNIYPKKLTGDLSTLVPNVEWSIKNFTVSREEKHFDCCKDPFPYLNYSIRMKRKPNFYVINLILPSMFVMALSICVFIVPVESGEKLSFAVSLMLALAVFQLMLADTLPPSAETVPLIAEYFAISEGLVAFVCLSAIAVLNIHYQGEKELPSWVRRLILGGLARMVCVTWTKSKYKPGVKDETNTSGDRGKSQAATNDNTETDQGDSSSNDHSPEYKTTRMTLSEEWKIVAIVVERTISILFVIVLLTISLYVFISLAS